MRLYMQGIDLYLESDGMDYLCGQPNFPGKLEGDLIRSGIEWERDWRDQIKSREDENADLEEKFDSLELGATERITELEDEVKKLMNKDVIDTLVEEYQSLDEETKEEISDLKKEIENLEYELAQTKDVVSNMEDEVEILQAKVDNFEEGLALPEGEE